MKRTLLREEHGDYMLDCWIMPADEYRDIINETGFTMPR